MDCYEYSSLVFLSKNNHLSSRNLFLAPYRSLV